MQGVMETCLQSLMVKNCYPDSEPAPIPYGIRTGNPGHSGISLGMGKPSQIMSKPSLGYKRAGWASPVKAFMGKICNY